MNPNSSVFANEVRVRACGLLVESASVLLVQLHSPVSDELIWTPPGGGVQLGEPMTECLCREFAEETHLEIVPGPLVHLNELISPPFHAIECYFEVARTGGGARRGNDPELARDRQMIKRLTWMPLPRLDTINFAPPGLLGKLQDWENRSSFDVFESG